MAGRPSICSILTDFLCGILQGGADDAGDQFVLADSFGTYVNGGGGNDWIGAGNAETDVFDGGAGDDYLTLGGPSARPRCSAAPATTRSRPAAPWNKMLLGGDGNDTFQGSLSGNLAVGGAGDDVWNYNSSSAALDGGTGNDVLFSQSGNNNLFLGGAGNDCLGSNGTSNKQFGGDGNDCWATPAPAPSFGRRRRRYAARGHELQRLQSARGRRRRRLRRRQR